MSEQFAAEQGLLFTGLIGGLETSAARGPSPPLSRYLLQSREFLTSYERALVLRHMSSSRRCMIRWLVFVEHGGRSLT